MPRIAVLALVLVSTVSTIAQAQLRPGRAPLAPGEALVLERTFAAHGFTIARHRRHVDGIPVEGGTGVVAVRTTRDGRVDLISGDGGPRDVDRAPPAIDAAAAAAIALGAAPADWRDVRTVETRPVWADAGGVLVRAFAVELAGATPMQRLAVRIDARDGRLLGGRLLPHHARGRVYDPNPPRAMDMTTEVELPDLTSTTRLTGHYVRVSGCQTEGTSCDPTQHAIADEAGDFLYDPREPAFDDEFSEVSAYFHTSRVSRYFRDVHGFTWSCCGAATVMQVISNYVEATGVAYDNAAYSPSSCGSRPRCGLILLGQGMRRDYGYDGDVIYHEFTHAMVSEAADISGFDIDDLGVNYEPLGINEGTADYFAGAVAGDPEIGEYFAGGSLGSHTALRGIDNELRCPTDLMGEGHQDGRLWSGLGWTIRGRVAAGTDAADAMFYAAVASTGGVGDFADATEALIATAETMEADGRLMPGDAAIVRAAIDERGLGDCERVIPLDDGMPRIGYSGVEFATGSLGHNLAPIHYRLDVPADATAVRVSLRRLTFAGRYSLHVREGRPVLLRPASRPAIRSDAELGEARSYLIDAATDPALPRCTTLYFGVELLDLTTSGQSLYEISASVERSGDPAAECPEPPPSDAGAGPADAGAGGDAGPSAPAPVVPSGGGCGCAAPGSSGGPGIPAAASLIALIGVLGIRRGPWRRPAPRLK